VIDEMTVFDAEELCSYWSRHPPTHVLVAAFLGVKSDEPALPVRRSQPSQEIPVGVVLAAMPGLAAGTNAGLPPPIFDAAALMALMPNR
jgi:hypothetical protein